MGAKAKPLLDDTDSSAQRQTFRMFLVETIIGTMEPRERSDGKSSFKARTDVYDENENKTKKRHIFFVSLFLECQWIDV